MSEGDRRHDLTRETPARPSAEAPQDAGNAATLAGGHGAPSPGLGATVATQLPRDIDVHGATIAGAPLGGDGQAATLPGPGVVADLPRLPSVDPSSYAIGPEIARGGMGRILSARDRRLRRDVVIKVARHDGTRIDPRFEREALITARLQHPSIVRVYEAGVLDGRAFYAMERVRGRSLEVVLEQAPTLAERLALLPHAIAVADAIAYAHSEGVLHRDLKPSNVLVGPFGETVVIDWGLAKDLRAADPTPDAARDEAATRASSSSSSDGSLTEVGSVLGTPSYMAPEQARGEAVDERTDIYALGALVYTMLTGAPPARGRTTEEVIHQVATGARIPIAERETDLPPELATIVERAMAHAPEERYQDAKLLADELRQFAAGKLVASHSYSLWRLLKRWLWRHRITVGVAGVAAVALVATLVFMLHSTQQQRDRADAARVEAETQQALAQRESATMIVRFARRQLAIDPSTAAAWLKILAHNQIGALEWPSTLDVAREAGQAGLARVLIGHTDDVEHVIASPDGIHVATGSDDGTVRWWRLDDGTSIVWKGHVGPIETMTMSPDGKYLATAGTDHHIFIWELATGAFRKLLGHQDTVRGVAFSPDLKRLASTSEEGSLFLWDVDRGTGKELLHHHHGLRPVVWSNDGKMLIVGGYDGQIARIDPDTGKARWQQAHAAELRTLVLSPDGTLLAAGDEDGVATLWSLAGERVRELGGHTDVVRNLVFTPDGKHLASSGGDALVDVYQISDGSKIVLKGNTSGVKGLDVSRDGTAVASAGIDGTVWVWPITGGKGRRLLGHGAAVKAVSFTPDGRLVSGSEDDRARIWSLGDTPAPPSGDALIGWLNRHTNLTVDEPSPSPN